MSDLAERLRPFQIRDDAVTSPELAEAWGLKGARAREIIREMVADGRLVRVKTRRDYGSFSKVVYGYAEPDT